MLASASAAALATLAITVAVPAIADDPGAAEGPDGLAACLRDNGLPGAPGGDALKPWLGPRLERGDATAQRALEKCAPKPTVHGADGPEVKDVRACLTDHGVAVPGGDGVDLKRWLSAHGDEAAIRDALKTCHVAPPGQRGGDGPCGGKGPVLEVVRGGRADRVVPAEPRDAGAQGTN